jgi:hypothetical protein
MANWKTGRWQLARMGRSEENTRSGVEIPIFFFSGQLPASGLLAAGRNRVITHDQ